MVQPELTYQIDSQHQHPLALTTVSYKETYLL
jgi:hypothetical protein